MGACMASSTKQRKETKKKGNRKPEKTSIRGGVCVCTTIRKKSVRPITSPPTSYPPSDPDPMRILTGGARARAASCATCETVVSDANGLPHEACVVRLLTARASNAPLPAASSAGCSRAHTRSASPWSLASRGAWQPGPRRAAAASCHCTCRPTRH